MPRGEWGGISICALVIGIAVICLVVVWLFGRSTSCGARTSRMVPNNFVNGMRATMTGGAKKPPSKDEEVAEALDPLPHINLSPDHQKMLCNRDKSR